MSSGKVSNPDGPGATPTLGAVDDINGQTYSFFNTALLKKDEPVIFDIEIFKVKINGNYVDAKIAILEQDKNGKPLIAENPWSKNFKNKWKLEWEKEEDDKILALDIKKKHVDKKELLTYDRNNQGNIELV